jgi:hypothetical protein
LARKSVHVTGEHRVCMNTISWSQVRIVGNNLYRAGQGWRGAKKLTANRYKMATYNRQTVPHIPFLVVGNV